MVSSIFVGPPNTIKQEQREFQALKKAAGNTFLAQGHMLNYVATYAILGGSFIFVTYGLYSMALGKNKIKLDKD